MQYENLVLVLQVCSHCGRHGTVLVKDGEATIQEITVNGRQEARSYNDQLVERGGVNQAEFLAQVAASTLVEAAEAPDSLTLLTFLLSVFGGVVRVRWTTRTASSACRSAAVGRTVRSTWRSRTGPRGSWRVSTARRTPVKCSNATSVRVSPSSSSSRPRSQRPAGSRARCP